MEFKTPERQSHEPYPTFVSSIIHKFINGTLVEERK